MRTSTRADRIGRQWGQAFSYNGLGNLVGKAVTKRITGVSGLGKILVDFMLPTGEKIATYRTFLHTGKIATYRTFLHNGHGLDGANGAEPYHLPTNGQMFCIGFRWRRPTTTSRGGG
jgi:hypothetical protein